MYALVDCNNFYCSVERVFNPKLEGRPVIVLSNNDGCAISRSDEAKALGIAMAAPAFIMRKFLEQHQVAVLSSNYTLYGDMSRRIMDSLGFFAPKIEMYSIDEAFLDLHEMVRTDFVQLGLQIRKTIKKNIGIPVSIGIGRTKTLAKMANRHAKKYYKHVSVFCAANPDLISEMLRATPVEEIWGIGHQYALFLKRSGFRTASDLLQAPDDWVRKNFSVVGHRLLFELRGIPSIAWEQEKPVRKNICTSRSFGTRISEKNGIAEAMANYAASCAVKLRAEKTCCRRIQVFIQTNPHKTDEAQYLRSVDIDLDRASNHSGEIIKAALRGLDLVFKSGFLYMKCGVTVMDLVPESTVQGSFFETADRDKNSHAMRTIDKINQSLGKEIIRQAVQGFERPYQLKTDYLSSRFTTRMAEILRIRN